MERKALIESLNGITDCSEDTKQQFAQLFQRIQLEKGQLLTSPASSVRSIHFLFSGMLHQYQNLRISQATHKPSPTTLQTVQFITPYEFVGNFDESISSTNHYLSTLLPSVILTLEHHKWKQFSREKTDAIAILYHLQQLWIIKLFQQLQLLQMPAAIDRYHVGSEKLGSFLYHIPRQHLASYLAISRKHLGRINSSILRNRNNVTTGNR